MSSLLSSLVAALLLVNLVAVGSSRVRSVVRAVALQGVLLGVLTVVAHGEVAGRVLLLALASMVVKGWLIPRILFRALREVAIQREVEPALGFLPSVLLGALATVVAASAPASAASLEPFFGTYVGVAEVEDFRDGGEVRQQTEPGQMTGDPGARRA